MNGQAAAEALAGEVKLEIRIGDKTYRATPPKWRVVRTFMASQAEGTGDPIAQTDAVLTMLSAVLRPNHPECDFEWCLDAVGSDEFDRVMEELMACCGGMFQCQPKAATAEVTEAATA